MDARSSTLTRPWRRLLAALVAGTLALTGAGVALNVTQAQAAELTYTHTSGATIKYNNEVVAGEPIVLSGTKWTTKPGHAQVNEGEEGSIVGVKFMPSSGGTVVRSPKPANPWNGDTDYASPDVWEIIQAAGNGSWWAGAEYGSWQKSIPWPSAANGATNPPNLQPGDKFSLQFLGGTLYGNQVCSTAACEDGRPDVSRTINLEFTVVAPKPVGTAPTIAASPAPANGTVGAAYPGFTVPASGDPTPNAFSITAGALPGGLSLNATTGAITGTPTAAGTFTFTVRAANGIDPAATRQYTITIAAATAPLAVSQQPQGASVGNGAQASFTAAATGGATPVRVQWQRSTSLSAATVPTTFADIDGATNTTLTVTAGTNPNVTNRWYRAVFTDAGSATVTTNAAKLTVLPAPTVTQHPNSVGQTIRVGDTATFTAKGTSGLPMTVQWQSTRTSLPSGDADGATWQNVSGATGETLTVNGTNSGTQHGTFYRAAFTNASGTTYSYPAELRFFDKLNTNAPVSVSAESYGPVTPNQPFSVSAPNALVKGQPIVITGTGYKHPDGAQGSVANFMVDASYSGDPNTLNTTRTITNPATGAVFADKRSHGIVQANADGTWRMEIPWPSAANTDRDAAFFASNWSTGSQHIVRILTGSLLTGDYQRGISVRFTIVDEATPPAGTAPAVTTQPSNVSVDAGQDATFTAAASGTPAPTVQWQSSTNGTSWTDVAGATQATLRLTDVTDARNGTRYRAVFTNTVGTATSNAAVLTVTPAPTPTPTPTPTPEPQGSLTLTTTEVQQYGDIWFNLSKFTPGTAVSVELANGAGETVASSSFTIGADGNTANPDGQTYRKVTVPRNAAPGSDYTVRVRNTATNAIVATAGPVTVNSVTTRVYNPGDHAGGVEDVLVQVGGSWTFRAVGFTPNDKLTATARIGGETVVLSGSGQISASEKAWQLDANGDTSHDTFTRIQLPSNVAAGDLEVTFSDGSRTVTRTLTVESSAEASVTVASTAQLGGTIRVTGTGFLHPNGAEGSKVAIKINDGQYSRVDASLHTNRTIWWIVDADEAGTFSIDMPVPNGTTADGDGTLGSVPALVPGDGFKLRFLTGNLKPGDQSRTLDSTAFSITAPVEDDTTAPVVSARVSERTVTVTATDDGSGVERIETRLDNGEWQPYAAPFDVPGTAGHRVEYRAFDAAGNESATGVIRVAATAPSGALNATGLGAERIVLVGESVFGYGIRLVDSTETAVRGVPVTFTVTGGTFVGGRTAAQVVTNAAGIAVAPAATATATGDIVITAAFNGGELELAPVHVVEPEASLGADITAETSVVANRVVITVSATNTGAAAATIVVKTPYGSKTFTDVQPNAQVTHVFKTYMGQISAGKVTATVSNATGTAAFDTTYQAR